MSPAASFQAMLARLRAGDEAAVRAFVETYEPYLRRSLRRRLRRSSLQAAADSADVCQAVLATFLIHVAAGSYSISGPEQLTRLLLGIARRKFAALQRHELAECRDRRRSRSLTESGELPESPSRGPESLAVNRDLYATVGQRLNEEERRLFELRRLGHTWDSIAAEIGGDQRALRQQLSRALRRVTDELDGAN